MSCSWKQLETTFVATITWLNVLSNNIYIARGTHTGLDWGYDTQRVPRKHSLHYYTHTHTHTPSVWTVGMRLVGFMDSCSWSQIMTRPSGCCTMMITLLESSTVQFRWIRAHDGVRSLFWPDGSRIWREPNLVTSWFHALLCCHSINWLDHWWANGAS